jgi:phenylacetate-CoA ligase
MVEVKRELFTDETRGLEALRRQDRGRHEVQARHPLKVKLVEPKTIERSIGKAKRVIDRRKI